MFDRILHNRVLPKVIDGRTHAVLDALTTSTFFMLASFFWGRNRRAATTALINGLAVMGVSMFTNYPGGQRGPISFETHGKIDVMQAGMAAGMPLLLGFGGTAAAAPFRMQAIIESILVGMTDWDAGRTADMERDLTTDLAA